MITKTGMIDLMLAGGYGAHRAGQLNDPQKAALKEKYGLGEDSSLTLRNAGRGVAGYLGGSMLGSAGGLLAGGAIGALARNPVLGAGLGMTAGGIGGAIYGAKRATNKYSPERAKEIIRSKQKTTVLPSDVLAQYRSVREQ